MVHAIPKVEFFDRFKMTKTALPDLILLPGLDGGGTFFSPLLAALSSDIKATVVTYPERPLSYEAMAEDLLPRLPTERDYVIVAESFGGPLAVLLAAQAKHPPKGLILAASFGRSPFPMMGMLLSTMRSTLLDPPGGLILSLLLRPDDRELAMRVHAAIKALPPEVVMARVKAVLSCNVEKALAALSMPILYIQGAQDKLISDACGQRLKLTARHVKIARIDRPHFVLQYDAEATVREVIEPFLAGLS
jgi:pimeloyl-ACP methyl ester carboxylesterase